MGTDDKDSALFGECKWTNEKVDIGILNTLVERSQMFKYKNVYLYLFSRSGFTKGCIEAAEKMENVMLVKYDEMVQKNQQHS